MKEIEKLKQDKIVLYQDDIKNIMINVIYNDETFWLNQTTIAELFGVDRSVITKHLKNIFETNELNEDSVCAKIAHTANDGKKYNTKFYSLDAIIAVGYRVNSKEATKFRIWATNTLKEFITKGFVLNDDLLKNGKKFGKDYFDELLERIRDIRTSERRAYQKIADIFETCSADYDKTSEETKTFYKIIQNKLHYAVTGETAAEIIYNRADSKKPFMGLTTWKGAPDKKIMRSDTHIAKNYLNEKEMNRLTLLVNMFIDRAELAALNEEILTMDDWLRITNKFLELTDNKILQTAGSISHELAIAKANEEYDKFKVIQDKEYISNFDEELERYLKGRDDNN